MRKFVLTLVFISIAPALHAAPINWTGVVDNNWSVAGNWAGGNVPTPNDEAIIQAGTPIAALLGSTLGLVEGVDVRGALHVNQSADLNLRHGAFHSSLVRSGAELRAQHFSSIFVSTFHSLAIDSGATMNVMDGVRFVTNANTDGVNFNKVNLNAGAQLNVRDSAVMEVRGDLENRDGIITLSGAAHGANIGAGADLTNAGTMHVQSSAGFNNEANTRIFQQGTLNINAGSKFENAAGATFSHTGSTLNVSDQGTMTVSSNLTQNNGSHVVHNNGQFTNNGGTVGTGNSPGTLTIDGDYTQGATGTLAIEMDLGPMTSWISWATPSSTASQPSAFDHLYRCRDGWRYFPHRQLGKPHRPVCRPHRFLDRRTHIRVAPV